VSRAAGRRLLIVAPEYPPQTGGMETHAAETVTRLRARGHLPTVLTAAGLIGPAASAAGAAEPVLGRDFGAALHHIARRAREIGAEAILLMNAGYAPLALRGDSALPPILARTVGNDVYGAWHGPRLPLRFLFWRLPHGRKGSLGARLRRLDQERRAAAIVQGLKRCDAVLCNSRYVRSRLESLGVGAERLALLVGGVDPARFHPRDPGPAGPLDRPVLGLAGRLKPIKGVEVAFEALAALRRDGLQARLLLAGAGPEEGRLRERARHPGLAGAVEFLGDLGPEAMPAFYRRLDLYLQPSIEILHPDSGAAQAESMGRALLEAQAAGVPVVASRSGGIPDVVEDGTTGVLVPPGDAAGLAAAIAALCADADRRARLAAAARRAVVDRFSWEAVVRDTEAAITAAILRRGSGSEADRVGRPA
jgi:glycosyltransferase involved in cell wall biosynthesis